MEPVVECVRRFRDDVPSHGELEVRLGFWSDDDGSFRPGVSHVVFEQLQRDLEETPTLQAEAEWREVVDYFYATGRNETTRTRVVFDPTCMQMSTEHVKKRGQSSVVMRRRDEGDEVCRVAWSSEVPHTDCPGACVPTHVRIKQRRCFRDVRDGRVVWSYELSKTWSGSSRSAVEHLQHVSEPTYEVECELVDEGRAYVSSRTDEQVARSLVAKASMLLGEEPADDSLCAMDGTFRCSDNVKSSTRPPTRKRARR